jgi:hypothetical protein
MKLDKFIIENCCNYVSGNCIGVWNHSRFNDTSICHPINKEEQSPCKYFEKAVLPYAIKLGCHEELVDSYSQIDLGIVKRTKEIRNKQSKKLIKTGKRVRKYAKSSTR